jgi:hypothetical protein
MGACCSLPRLRASIAPLSDRLASFRHSSEPDGHEETERHSEMLDWGTQPNLEELDDASGKMRNLVLETPQDDDECLGGEPVKRFERRRDAVLRCLAHPDVAFVTRLINLVIVVLIILFGLLIAWSMLGLFLGIDNSWNDYFPECVEWARLYNQYVQETEHRGLAQPDAATLRAPADRATHVLRARRGRTLAPDYIPKPPDATWGWSSAHQGREYCTTNQFVFNLSIKAFVIIFTYVNGVKIPWRLAILHHAWCSERYRLPILVDGKWQGFDFYGRRTKLTRFAFPKARRRQISLLQNLAVLFHMLALLFHCVYRASCATSTQTLPTLPRAAPDGRRAATIGCTLCGRNLSGGADMARRRRSERALCAASPLYGHRRRTRD